MPSSLHFVWLAALMCDGSELAGNCHRTIEETIALASVFAWYGHETRPLAMATPEANVASFRAHDGAVAAASYHRDGERLAAAVPGVDAGLGDAHGMRRNRKSKRGWHERHPEADHVQRIAEPVRRVESRASCVPQSTGP